MTKTSILLKKSLVDSPQRVDVASTVVIFTLCRQTVPVLNLESFAEDVTS